MKRLFVLLVVLQVLLTSSQFISAQQIQFGNAIAGIMGPILGIGALDEMKISKDPNVPIILSLLKELTTDVAPCLLPCLVDQVWDIMKAFVSGQGPYSECRMNIENGFQNFSSQTIFLNSSTTIFCPFVTEIVDCVLNTLAGICGFKLRQHIESIGIRDELLSLLDCVPGKPKFNFLRCTNFDDVFVEKLANCTLLINQQFLNIFTDTWALTYDAEVRSNFDGLCRLGPIITNCFITTMRAIRLVPNSECVHFDDAIQRNAASIIEQMNCYNNATEALKCLGNPMLYKYDYYQTNLGPESIVDRCGMEFTKYNYTILDPNVYGLHEEQTLTKARVDAYVQHITQEVCPLVRDSYACFLDTSLGIRKYPECAFLVPGLKKFSAPLLDKVYKLGGCISAFNADETEAIEKCQCLRQNTTPCSGVKLNFVISVIVRRAWNDAIADKSCEEIRVLHRLCATIESNILDKDSTFNFLGVRPTRTDDISVVYEARVPQEKLEDLNYTITALFRTGSVNNIKVSPIVTMESFQTRDVDIHGVWPTKGPIAGGTPITVTGNFLNVIEQIQIGNNTCTLTNKTEVVILCTTMEATMQMMSIPVSYKVVRQINFQQTRFVFEYLPNPVIEDIHPLDTILSGGVNLTVSGSNFDVVTIRIMETTVTALATLKMVIYKTTCTGGLSKMIFCPTPKIDLKDLFARRRRREANSTVNYMQNINVTIAFILDGVLEYKDLTKGQLANYSSLTVYRDPLIDPLSPSILTFTPIWPVNDKTIEIKGEKLLQGIQEADYRINIGNGMCTKLNVFSNKINCEPPSRRPPVGSGQIGDNLIPVMLLLPNVEILVGHLKYVQTLWEYPPSRYGFIAGIVALLLIVAIAIVCFICKRRPPTHNQMTDKAHRQTHHMEYRDKKSKNKLMKRFSSFIPSGHRFAVSHLSNNMNRHHEQRY